MTGQYRDSCPKLHIIFYAGQGMDSTSTRRNGRLQHRPLTQDGGSNNSPTQSPRRRRKHKHNIAEHNGNATSILPNGYIESQDNSQQEVTISLSALSKGRIPDSSFEIEDNSLTRNSPENLSAVPNIECSPVINTSACSYNSVSSTSQQQANNQQNMSCPSASVAGIPANLNQVTAPNWTTISNNAVNSGAREVKQTGSRPSGKKVPPPLPPRKYKERELLLASGVQISGLDCQASGATSSTAELSVPQGFPSKETTSSFDSMEAFSGSNENVTCGVATVGASIISAGNVPSSVAMETSTADQSPLSSADAAPATNEIQASSSMQESSAAIGNTDNEDTSPSEATVVSNETLDKSLPNTGGSFDESGATSESYESANETFSTSEKNVISATSSPLRTQPNNACAAASSFVSSIAAQLARIPTIESAVSDRNCCPMGTKPHDSIVDSPATMSPSHVKAAAYVKQESTGSDCEVGVSSTGAKAQIVVTAQPTAQENSRPVLMGVTHSHAVPLTAVIPVTSELARQDSNASTHSTHSEGSLDSPNNQVTKHTSVHLQQISKAKHKNSPPQNRVAIVKPVPAPRHINRDRSQDSELVFTFTTGGAGSPAGAGQGEEAMVVSAGEEPLSPRRRALSEAERLQNRHQIQQQLARWHQQRAAAVGQQGATPYRSAENGVTQVAAVSPQSPVTTSNISVLLNANSTSRETRDPSRPPPPPPRDGSSLSNPPAGSSNQPVVVAVSPQPVVNALTPQTVSMVTSPSHAPPPPPRDGSTLSTQPPATTVSAVAMVPFAMTTVLTTNPTDVPTQVVQATSAQSIDQVSALPGPSMVGANQRDFTSTREAIQQRLLQWHQQQQALHRQHSQSSTPPLSPLYAPSTPPVSTVHTPQCPLPQHQAIQQHRTNHHVR